MNTHSDLYRRRRRRVRRGFNLVELLIALSISAALLTATMMALSASFVAYQSTTELASTHTISRLALHRILTLIRTGTEFGPTPVLATDSIRESTFIDFRMPNGDVLSIEWDEDDESLYVVDGGAGGDRYLLLSGVTQDDGAGGTTSPFTLEYERGFRLYRATVDLTVVPDDSMSVTLDGEGGGTIRLVATAMPRMLQE